MNESRYFYSVLKNEDAAPYVDDNVIIVADGLGGAGSTVHDVSPIEGTTLHDEIFEAVFCDFDMEKAKSLIPYLEHWIYPMTDGKPDTSALWASRIAIARCAYALRYNPNFVGCDLADAKIRDRLSEFISKGLNNTAMHFNLRRGKYDDQKVLPTTLAFMRYSTDKKDNAVVEVLWAGDSRCYALTRDGLKQLSVDDEDKSGAITNLFFVGGKNPTVLNYMKYKMDSPCVLIGASDGIFDPFEPHDNFGVEKTLLEHIERASSYEELMKTLCEFYGKVRSDDATMAFVPIGFKDYAAMKKTFAKRTEYILRMWHEFCDMNSAMEIADRPEEDIRGYVESRTRDKLEAIMTLLSVNQKSHADDWIYTNQIAGFIDKGRARVAEQRKLEAVARIQSALSTLRIDIKARLEDPALFLAPYSGCEVSSEIRMSVEKVRVCHNNLENLYDKKARNEKIADEKSEWRKIIGEYEVRYWKEFNEAKRNGAAVKERERLARSLRIWMLIDTHFEKCSSLINYNDLSYDEKIIAKKIDNFIGKNKNVLTMTRPSLELGIADANKKYEEAIDKLFDILEKNPNVCESVFTMETVKKYGLTSASLLGQREQSDECGLMLSSADKDAFVSAIVDALAQYYDKESMIDLYYNATRLNAFRALYRLKARPNTKIAAFEKKLAALEAEYEQLIAKAMA